jgi:RNA polymerase sigma-70 factor (ECF subfamily)
LSIVRNAAYSWAKKNSKDSNVIPFDEELHTPPWNEYLLPSHRQDRINQIHAALALLPAEFREILLLRDIEGWSYKELTSILNIPSGTVMSRLSRARQRLRQELVKVQDRELQNGL